MKQQPPNKQLRLMLTNLYQTYNLSIQTLHTTIKILMNPNMPENANQDPDICIAALHVSQKLHESIYVPVSQLCSCARVQQKIVLDMEEVILKSVGYRIAQPLLIDQCFQVANNWDKFISYLSCIDVRFFCNNTHQKRQIKQNQSLTQDQKSLQQDIYNKKQIKQKKKVTIFAYKNLTQICQKLAYNSNTQKYNIKKLSLAIVALVIKQTERYEQKISIIGRDKHLLSIQAGTARSFIHKLGSFQHRSTDFIIADFMDEVYGVSYHKQLAQEIKFVKSNNYGLKDLTTQFKNVKNISERSQFNSNTKRLSQSFRVNSSLRKIKNSKLNVNKTKNKKCL